MIQGLASDCVCYLGLVGGLGCAAEMEGWLFYVLIMTTLIRLHLAFRQR